MKILISSVKCETWLLQFYEDGISPFSFILLNLQSFIFHLPPSSGTHRSSPIAFIPSLLFNGVSLPHPFPISLFLILLFLTAIAPHFSSPTPIHTPPWISPSLHFEGDPSPPLFLLPLDPLTPSSIFLFHHSCFTPLHRVTAPVHFH